MIDYNQLIQWAFFGIIGFVALRSSNSLDKLDNNIEHMGNSVNDLNAKIGTIIEKTVWIEKTLDRHQTDIETLKKEKNV